MPIAVMVLGVGDAPVYFLLAFAAVWPILLNTAAGVSQLDANWLLLARSRSATCIQTLLRVLLPQVLPRLIEAVRLTLGSAWLFLIAAEAIAATAGLGYRIFLVRRYLDMAVILPYVLWITLLAFAMDYLLRQLARWAFPWYYGRGGEGAAT